MEKQPSSLARARDRLAPPAPVALAFDRLAPARTALFVIDLNRGFAEKGALFSPLCRALLPGVAGLLRRAKETGVETLLFTDTHTPDSPEFTSYPPHCVKGTGEEEICPELLREQWGRVIPKASTNACLEPAFWQWRTEHPGIDTFLLTGCCTDICIQQAALTLKAAENRCNRPSRVIVLTDLVATFEGPGHPATLCSAMALQNMAQSGVELARMAGPDQSLVPLQAEC